MAGGLAAGWARTPGISMKNFAPVEVAVLNRLRNMINAYIHFPVKIRYCAGYF
jgi:hypothetical protein